MMKKFILFLSLFLLISPVLSSISVFEQSTYFISYNISFNLSEKTIDYATYNGNILSDFDNRSVFYLSEELIPDSSQIFRIYYNDSSYDENISKTLPVTETNEEKVFGFAFQYILIIVIIITYGLAVISEHILAVIGEIFTFIGITSLIDNYSFATGSIFIILLIVGFFILYREV